MTQAEDWCFYFEEEEGKPMAIFLNKGLSKVAPIELLKKIEIALSK